MINKIELEADFLESIGRDTSIKRSKKRERKRNIEKPQKHFLKYLGDDPKDLMGEGFICSPRNKKEQENYQLFFKLWKRFLVERGLAGANGSPKNEVSQEKAKSIKTEEAHILSEMDTRLEITPVNKALAGETKEMAGISSHAQYKLYNLSYLMDDLGIEPREIEEAEYRAVTTREEQLAIENLGRRIYAESELIKVGNSNGMDGTFRYFYHWDYNLITILPEKEESIVTIYKPYISQSMAEEILLEKRRNEEIHSAALKESQISYRRVEDLLEYRKRQVEMLEKQRVALGRSIEAIEGSFEECSRDMDRIINERKFFS